MADMMSDANAGGYRRLEVLTGPKRRRDWTDDDKARAVAESCAPGAVASHVARRWQIAPQQLFTWRRQARAAARRAATAGALSFVPIVADARAPAAEPDRPQAVIEVEVAGAVVRVPSSADAVLLTAVLRALRASVA
jgi:transposase